MDTLWAIYLTGVVLWAVLAYLMVWLYSEREPNYLWWLTGPTFACIWPWIVVSAVQKAIHYRKKYARKRHDSRT